MRPEIATIYTKTPNAFLERLCIISLGQYEIRVIAYVLRHTFGWHKTRRLLNVSKIAKATSIKRQNVQRTLRSLGDRQILRFHNDKKTGKPYVGFWPADCWLDKLPPQGTLDLELVLAAEETALYK